MPGRQFNTANYRYGFNGKENDNDVKGTGNQQDYGMRVYDPRLGKFLSVDPLTREYPWYTPYQYAGNKPIKYIDRDGLEEGNPMIPGDMFRSAIDNVRAGYSINYHIDHSILAPAKQYALEINTALKKRQMAQGYFKAVNWQEKYFEGKSDFERVLTTDPSMQFVAQTILFGGAGKIIFSKNSLAAGKLGGALSDFTTQQINNKGDFSKYNITSTAAELNPFKNIITSSVYQGVMASFFSTQGFKYTGIGSTEIVSDADFLQKAKESAFNVGGNIIGDYPGTRLDRWGIPKSSDFLQSYMFNSFGNVISNEASDTYAPPPVPVPVFTPPKKVIN